MRLKPLLPVVLLSAVVGCSSLTKPQPSQKAAMTEQWNAARAGVQGTLAKEQYENGNLDGARVTINNALAMNPKNATLRIISAKIAMEQGQLDVAEKDLRRAQWLDPQNADADYLCGVVYQRWQKPEDAYELYEQASSKAPGELGYVLAASEMLVEMRRPDDALNMLQAKSDYFEHSPEIRDAIGQLLVGKGQYEAAIASLRQASMLATDDLSIKEHLGLALYFNKQYRDSADLLSRLVSDEKYKQRVDLFLALGECYEQTGRLDDAKGSFETATQVSPGTPEAWVSLAKVSLEKNDLRRAEMSLHRAVTLDPGSGESQLLLGYIRLRQNKLEEALPFFKKASELNQGDTVSLCMVGYVYEKSGKTDLAVQCYAQALKLNPGDAMATKLMASLDMN